MMIVKRRRLDGELEATTVLRERGPAKMKMSCGALYLPKDDEDKPLGEDAHFICAEKQTIGVADGVGGWAKKGVDAGEYARQLMKNAEIASQKEPNGEVQLKRVLGTAFLNTKAQGSSTACIVTLKQDYYLHAIYVGDSGFMIFRDKKFVYKSPIQQRCFNCPRQLGNSNKSDKPCSAIEIKVGVVPGDIIVLGTDGLLNNMFPAEIEDVIKKTTLEEGVNPEKLALTIADLALYNSFDRFFYSPYARAARKAGKEHSGGKIDDITVIVAHILPYV